MAVDGTEVVNLGVVPKPRPREDTVIHSGNIALATPMHEQEQAGPTVNETALVAGALATTEIDLDDLGGPDPDSDPPGTESDTDEAPDPVDTDTASTKPTTADKANMSDTEGAIWDLVERAQEGNPDAFAQIYVRYKDMVERFAYFKTGNRQIAEDLTSDVFVRALGRIGSVTWQGRDLGAWLITIARNLVADHYKRGSTRFEVFTEDPVGAEIAARGYAVEPEAAVLEHISNVELRKAVQQLNPEQRQCVIYRFLMDFSIAETAAAMGKNENSIKALQYRAVRALGKRFEDEGLNREDF